MVDNLRTGKLQGGNQNNKRARTGFGQTLPITIMSSNKNVENYAKVFEARDEDIHDLEEGD